jgi:hypothetical protein
MKDDMMAPKTNKPELILTADLAGLVTLNDDMIQCLARSSWNALTIKE